MSFLIPWTLLEWARDNRVLRVRWFGLEAEFAVPSSPPLTFHGAESGDGAWQPSAEPGPGAGLPPEERERLRREREKAEAEKVLYHSA